MRNEILEIETRLLELANELDGNSSKIKEWLMIEARANNYEILEYIERNEICLAKCETYVNDLRDSKWWDKEAAIRLYFSIGNIKDLNLLGVSKHLETDLDGLSSSSEFMIVIRIINEGLKNIEFFSNLLKQSINSRQECYAKLASAPNSVNDLRNIDKGMYTVANKSHGDHEENKLCIKSKHNSKRIEIDQGTSNSSNLNESKNQSNMSNTHRSYSTKPQVSLMDTSDIENSKNIINQVQFSAIAPKKFIKGEYTLIEIIMYEEDYRNIVDKTLKKLGIKGDETNSGIHEVARRSKVRIILESESPDITLEDNMEEITWNGKFGIFRFHVFLPNSFSGKQIYFCAKVYVDMILFTKIKFIARVSSFTKQKIKANKLKILSAFISYASQDRNKVVARIQGMKKIIPDADIFFDVESLRSGQEWEPTLWAEIEKRDIFYLFWSSNAKKSEWVNKEWKYALNNKGIDAIEPVPLEPPEICPPPEELAKKHFNDWALRYSSIEETGVANGLAVRRLQLKSKINENEIIIIDKTNYSIGRRNTDMIIQSSTISEHHARIERAGNEFFLIDENSTNGTYVNNKKVVQNIRYKLEDGDILKFARKEYYVVIY